MTTSDVRWRMPAVPESVGAARHEATAYAERQHSGDAFCVALAVSEAVTSAVGGGGGPPRREVEVAARRRGRGIEISVCDEAGGHASGIGLSLIEQLTERVEEHTCPAGGTRLVMTFAA